MDVAAGRWTSSSVLDEIFGIGPEFDRSTEGWLSFVHPDDREMMARYLADEVIGAKRPFDKEYRIIRVNDGATRWVAGRGRVLADDAGRAISMLGTIQDITDRREAEATQSRLESMLVAAQKMEAIGRLAGGVAHDFNNMLTVILGNVEAALEEPEPGPELDASLGEIRTAALRSADLTRQLLAFARKQVITPKVQDLNSVVGGMLSMLRRLIGEDVRLAWAPGAELWPVLIDAVQVDQILANLCVNARDALARGGVIEIETSNVVIDEAFCQQHPEATPGDFVLLSVRDNGSGMDDKVLGQLFEPFFTTKPAGMGTGLGLATVYGIVRQNAGFIGVESAVDVGTTFSIYFPRHDGRSEAAEERSSGAVDSGAGRGRILVVEDEPAILRAIARRLASRGYEVLTAGTAAEALRHATASRAVIDLLLTDVILPGSNGRDLAAQVSALHPACKLLFMSGYSMDFISDHGVLEEGVHFIGKPMRFDDLDARVRALLAPEAAG
ncbi:MAG: ATP-binding protein [Chloroflexota bacterium]